MSLPLASLPAGRGTSPGYSITLNYSSKLWDSKQEHRDDGMTDENGNINTPYDRDLLQLGENGGWTMNLYYNLNIINRRNLQEERCQAGNNNYGRNAYKWKVEMVFPDGSVKEFRPYGYGNNYGDAYGDGYFAVAPNGTSSNEYMVTFTDPPHTSCYITTGVVTTSGMNYYTNDGSNIRLFIPYQGNIGSQLYTNWIMYFPDGKTIEQKPPDNPNIIQRITDRNGGVVIIKNDTYNGINGIKIEDALGRFIFSGGGKVYQTGMNGTVLETTIQYKDYYVRREYKATWASNAPQAWRTDLINQQISMVDKIILPSQTGSLEYNFTYNASPTITTSLTSGWGELKSVTLPSGAKAEYSYSQDTPPALYDSSDVIKNAVTKKDLTYAKEYDGTSQLVTETWNYASSEGGGSVTEPNGSTQTQTTGGGSGWDKSLVYREQMSDGTRIERIWQQNYAPRIGGANNQAINPYVKTEFTTIPDAQGQPSLTAIKDFTYDKNGNILEIKEYDWVPYSSIPHQTWGNDPTIGRVTGIPSNAVLKRITSNEYYNQTPVASDSTTDDSNIYANPAATKLKSVIKASETKDANGTVVSRSEFFYDDASNKGNLIEAKVWDSHKNGTYQAVSNPLTSTNSISTTTQYDTYGNPILTIDGKGTQTQITYGSINGYTGLYPTQVKSAYGTPQEQTVQTQYDFQTGLPTQVTAFGNTTSENIINQTEYDALGRPTKVKAAVGTANEIWSTTEYNDVLRRVITRSDIETKGDGKKIAIQHFDQLGRVRLTRSIENVLTEDPYNEQHGIKVQTRYETGNPYSYSLTSNPYRAATSSQATNEETMGWTRSKAINTNKHSEMETFSGASLPAPWGTNTSSTGKVQTDIDADKTLVTDQAGKQRLSRSNGLGQLTTVWEVKDADADTEAVTFGTSSLNALKTSYQYDTLNNLKQVNQGQQTRTFTYSSLSRLLTANNPESGLISYQYDNNGNLTTKIDARSISTTYNYDVLNRVTFRDYSDATPDVTYTYDATNIPFSKGKLTKVSNAISETKYNAYNIMGRVTNSQQVTDGTTYNPMTYTYNLSGALIEEVYPSGRVVKNTLDNDGELVQVQSRKANDTFRNYANGFNYNATGAVSSLKLGNGKWENTTFNSRLQPIQIGLGTSATSQNLLKLNFDYGTTDNNGNVKSQQITIQRSNQTPLIMNQSYVYDSLNRIKSAEEKDVNNATIWKQTYIFDRYGNRNFDEANTTTLPKNCGNSPNLVVCSADKQKVNPDFNLSNNRFSSGQYVYDLSGNIVQDAEGRTFGYDAENKQKSVLNGSATVGTYQFDGDGKRVKKISASEETIFVYDAGGKLVAEYSTQLAQTPKVNYTTNDHLGSPRITTDGNGAVISRTDYQPYGEEIYSAQRTSDLGYTVQDSVKQGFTGYFKDDETGLDYAQARMYKNSLGRFTGADPAPFSIKNPQELNRFIYVANNPLKFVDPTGETLVINGDDAEFLVSELAKHTGYNLERDKKTGIVTIKGERRKAGKGEKFSDKLANKLKQVIAKTAKVDGKEKAFTVTINAVNSENDDKKISVDSFQSRSLDMRDYKAMMDVKDADGVGDKGAFAATVIGHVLEEYFQAETTYKDLEAKGNGATSEWYIKSHAAAKVFESEVMSDFTGQKEQTRDEKATPLGGNYFYTSRRYTVMFMGETDKTIRQVSRRPIPKD
jgi:RHS repeat-associated protein